MPSSFFGHRGGAYLAAVSCFALLTGCHRGDNADATDANIAIAPHSIAATSPAPDCTDVADQLVNLGHFSWANQHEAPRQAVELCATLTAPQRRCVLAAHDAGEVALCAETDPGSDEVDASLDDLGAALADYVQSNGGLPRTSEAWSPIKPCCEYADGVCPPDLADPSSATWSALHFAIPSVHRYQYSYNVDPSGQHATISARADLSCTGHMSTTTLTATIHDREISIALDPATAATTDDDNDGDSLAMRE